MMLSIKNLPNFTPNPDHTDKGVFEKVKEMFR